MSFPPPPYGQRECPNPPYNATNFTNPGPIQSTPNGIITTSLVFSTLVNNAVTMPNYPWNTGTDAQQIFRSQQNVTYFNNVNFQTQPIYSTNVGNSTIGAPTFIPYPQFKSETERLMYKQGLALTASRNIYRNQNISSLGVPCSTNYDIIYPNP